MLTVWSVSSVRCRGVCKDRGYPVLEELIEGRRRGVCRVCWDLRPGLRKFREKEQCCLVLIPQMLTA